MFQACRNVLRTQTRSLPIKRTPALRSPISLFERTNQRMPLVTISQSLDEAYTKHKVVPDVVDPFSSQGLLTIEYSPEEQVALGNTLKVERTQHAPKIQFTINSSGQENQLEVSEEDKFLLVLTDPDAPSNSDHKWSEFAHWIVSDLPLNVTKSDSESSLSTVLDYTKGKEILSYVGPAPPPKSGKHRYVFLLFKQDPSATYEEPKGRPNWGTGVPSSGVRDWIKKVAPNLKLLGVNFFYAQLNE